MAADLARLRALSAEPGLVPQVYDYCDQWCEYCGLTDRCLASKWVEARGGGNPADLYQDLQTAARASGNGTRALVNPAVMAALASAGTHFSDPLEMLGREYAARAHMLLRSLDPEPSAASDAEMQPPGARAVLSRYHLVVAAKIFRAVAAAAIDPASSSSGDSDATGSAKIALLLIDRSRAAHADMAEAARDSRAADLIALLDRVEAELVSRFPLAPAFQRPGFDVPRTGPTERRLQMARSSLVSIYRDTA